MLPKFLARILLTCRKLGPFLPSFQTPRGFAIKKCALSPIFSNSRALCCLSGTPGRGEGRGKCCLSGTPGQGEGTGGIEDYSTRGESESNACVH